MAQSRDPIRPRTFFLNEQHELDHLEAAGGGALPKLAPINWATKGRRINKSLSDTRQRIDSSPDPVKRQRYFLMALPVKNVKKLSRNKLKAPKGTYEEPTRYVAEHSHVFRRLGLDLISVHENGNATVHAPADRIDRLLATTRSLADEGARAQARWATIDAFSPIPATFRIDQAWLKSLPQSKPTDAIVELQPLLSRAEIEDLLHALAGRLERASQEAFIGNGHDFSGRQWLRGRISRKSLESMARDFFSLQSLHPPLSTAITVQSRDDSESALSAVQPAKEADISSLPYVAVVDTGIPAGHPILAPYRRPGYQSPNSPETYLGNHGSFVASRVVFGDVDCSGGKLPDQPGTCRFVDVMVAESIKQIFDKEIVPALDAVALTSPDVRVFNLSLGDRLPLNSYNEVDRREKLLLVQDLDNFIFARDVLVIVAAGNTPPGLLPTSPYPNHFEDPNWALGSWASGFNTLTCGSVVERLSVDGLVKNKGWPSPFTRVGPGICGAPVPEFCAHGGNSTENYQPKAHLGVWGCTADAQWEDRSGTSHAAPLLAREAAFLLRDLQGVCEGGTRPFAATAKAFLALTALKEAYPIQIRQLVERTLGRGTANAERFLKPKPETAVMLWQGVLSSPGDIARIRIPISREWLKAASTPHLRILCSWDSPVQRRCETCGLAANLLFI